MMRISMSLISFLSLNIANGKGLSSWTGERSSSRGQPADLNNPVRREKSAIHRIHIIMAVVFQQPV